MGIVGNTRRISEPVATRSGVRGLRFAAGAGAMTMAALMGSTSVQAQCVGGSNYVANTIYGLVPVSKIMPLNNSTINGVLSVINTVNTSFLTSSTAFVSSPLTPPLADQEGSGVWARAIGGTVETKAHTSQTYDVSAFPVPKDTGVLNCDSKVKTTFNGYQFGHDIAVLNAMNSGANVHVGVTAGYLRANATDTTPPGGTFGNTFAGTFGGTFQVPFAGIYSSVSTKDGFFADAQVRYDSYRNNISNVPDGLFSQDFNGQGLSLTGNASYAIELPGTGITLTPAVGLVLSRVNVDPLNVAGSFYLANNPNFALPGTAKINDIISELARASLTAVTTIPAGEVTLQPFVTASVYHEFAGSVTTNLLTTDPFKGTANATGLGNIGSTMTTNRIGTYGQLGIGTAIIFPDTGWLAYVRGDYKTGQNITGLSVNAGLRYQYDAQAVAKEKGPNAKVGDAYDWTGPYVGATGGAARGVQQWTYLSGGNTVQPAYQGAILGGEAGYNFQTGQIVYGIEGDFSGLNAKGGVSCPNGFFFTCEASLSRLATVTGRVGYATGYGLYYAKAGLAYGTANVGTTPNTNGNPLTIPNFVFATGNSTTVSHTGWTAGVGVEFALAKDWSAKAEYMHFDLGSAQYTVDSGLLVNAKTAGDTVRVGVNYHFGN